MRELLNIFWLLIDNGIRNLAGLTVTIFLVRHLGPELYGLWAFVSSLLIIMTSFSSLGMNTVVVKELVRREDSRSTLLGSAFILMLGASVVSGAFMLLVVFLLRGVDGATWCLTGILFPLLIFKSSDVVRMWFEYRVASGDVIRIDNSLILAFTGVKIVAIVAGVSLEGIAWVFLVEGACTFCACFILYISKTHTRTWSFDFRVAIDILKQSWPMALAVIAVAGYYRVDQVMIAGFLGDSAVGIYSVATQISMALYAIPMAICSTYFPGLVQLRLEGTSEYNRRLKQLLSVLIYLSVLFGLVFCLISNQLIRFLYGDLYFNSGRILAIHVWSGVFVFAGVLINSWQVAEGYQVNVFIRTLSGLILNVILNSLLIPYAGIEGAAYASLISMAAVVFFLVFSSCREEALDLIKGGILLRGFGKHS